MTDKTETTLNTMYNSISPVSGYSDEMVVNFGQSNYVHKFNHTLFANSKNLIAVMTKLKNEMGYNMLLDVCGVDNLKRPKQEWMHGVRFESATWNG